MPVPIRVKLCARNHRQSGQIIFFGALIGFFIASYFKFDSYSDVNNSFHISYRNQFTTENKLLNIYLQCIVVVNPETQSPEKFISAVIDTYAPYCNETIYFSNSEKLVQKFAESSKIFHINISTNTNDWSFLYEVLHFSLIRRRDKRKLESGTKLDGLTTWTALLNEHNFLVVQNLRRFLSQQQVSEELSGDITPIIVGRLVEVKKPLSMLFPFFQSHMFALESGVILSDAAVRVLAEGKKFCDGAVSFLPKYSGKSLLKCAFKQDFRIWDPIDEDGHHLFVPVNLRSIFAIPDVRLVALFQKHSEIGSTGKDSDLKTAECCSDNVISFGLLSYRDIRLIHFAIDNLRVFGLSPFKQD